jgi:N-acetylmuramoyl-L-alanine amidase
MNSGATAQWGDEPPYTENEWAFAQSRSVGELVRGWPVQIYYTRDSVDEGVSLETRGLRSRNVEADLVVSIHFDSNPEIRGGRVYYLPDERGLGEEVAEQIGRSLPYCLHSDDPIMATSSKVWTTRVRNVLTPHLPAAAVLVEAFVSNHKGEALLASTPSGYTGIACAIASGISVVL